MQGCTLRPAECPVTASSPCHLSQVKAACLSAGSPGKALGVRLQQARGFDGEFMGEANGEASWALSSWWDGKTPGLLPQPPSICPC